MATHSSILTWKIPWTEKPHGLQSTGCKESDTTKQLYMHACTCPNPLTVQRFVMGIHGVVFQGYRPLIPPDKSYKWTT